MPSSSFPIWISRKPCQNEVAFCCSLNPPTLTQIFHPAGSPKQPALLDRRHRPRSRGRVGVVRVRWPNHRLWLDGWRAEQQGREPALPGAVHHQQLERLHLQQQAGLHLWVGPGLQQRMTSGEWRHGEQRLDATAVRHVTTLDQPVLTPFRHGGHPCMAASTDDTS